MTIFQRGPLNGSAKCKGVLKNYDLRPISSFISELMHDKAIVQTCGARFPLSPWYCSAIPCWPAAAGGGLGVTQKAAILGLGQTGHPEGATDHYRRPCILCRRSSRVEQFVVIDAECTFVACFYAAAEMRTVPSLLRFVLTDRPTLF